MQFQQYVFNYDCFNIKRMVSIMLQFTVTEIFPRVTTYLHGRYAVRTVKITHSLSKYVLIIQPFNY